MTEPHGPGPRPDTLMEDYYSDEALAKQAALDALPEGEPAPWSMLLGICEPRIKPTADERCTCCTLDARDAAGGRERHGERWCAICLARGHDEENDQ